MSELEALVKELRREHSQLRAKVQTSQDDAELLESFSVGVSLFDKKPEKEERKGTEEIEICSNALAEYGAGNPGLEAIAEYGQSGDIIFEAVTKSKQESGKKKKKKKKRKEGEGKKKKENRVKTSKRQTNKKQKSKKDGKASSKDDILLKAYHEIAYEELQLDSRPLGNGAFGVVYKALWRGNHELSDRTCACQTDIY